MKKRVLIYLASVLAGLLIFASLGYKVYKANSDPYKTQTALECKYEDTIDVTAYIIRDEQYVTTNLNGTSVPLVGEGEKVAVKDSVAVICGSQSDASTYAQIKDIEHQISRYTQLNSQKNLNAVNVGGLKEDIYNNFTDILNTVDSGDLSGFSDFSDDFRDMVTARQIAINGVMDFSGKISELNSKLTTLSSAAISAVEVPAESAGYFVSSTDGYENALDFGKAEGIDHLTLENAFSKAGVVSAGTIGRLVTSFNWYIAVVVENTVASQLEVGKSMKIIFPQSSVGSIQATVKSIKTSGDGKSAIVFSCNNVSIETLNFRVENAQLVMKDYDGYKIDSAAIRMSSETVTPEEGEELTTQAQTKEYKGVYIKIGDIVRFRKIEIIHSGSDYVIAALNSNISSADRSEYVGLYDEIIVGGKELYDGKIIS